MEAINFENGSSIKTIDSDSAIRGKRSKELQIFKYEDKCSNCYWQYWEQCVSEEKEVHGHPTQYTKQCIGFLDRKHEMKLYELLDECTKLLQQRSSEELAKIKEFMLSQREENNHVFEMKVKSLDNASENIISQELPDFCKIVGDKYPLKQN